MITTQTERPYGWLCNYDTAEPIRPATEDEQAFSRWTAKHKDNGAGVIEVDGQSVYVED